MSEKNEIDRVFNLHKTSYTVPTASERIDRLQRLGREIKNHVSEIEEAGRKDLGRNPTETNFLEIIPTLEELRFAIRNVKKWMKSKKVKTPLFVFGSRSQVQYVPRGACLIISPWNYPLFLSMGPIVGALAAGNRIILKPSEISSNTSDVLKKILAAAFDESEVAVFLGDHTVSTELLKKPFDHVFFTGSTKVGKVIMEAASRNLSSVTLELGGKSPVIIDETADLRVAARKITWGKFSNAGQTCVAPDYLFVSKKIKKQFLEEVQTASKIFYGPDPKDSPDLGRIVSSGHFSRLSGLLNESVKQGAQILFGGVTDVKSRMIEPTVLTGVTPAMPVMGEEIFGPILPVMEYDDLSEPINFIRAQPNPLSFYMFSKNQNDINRVLNSINAGGICINETVIHLGNSHLPFGGVGESGLGNYHGYYGFRAFSHERALLRQTRFNLMNLFYPPYTSRHQKIAHIFRRWLSRGI